ncbi:MAG: hypothetical protein KBD01_09030 [Acidobacteria bacterium]|nr:hypothetical protein [Acidobacteriota bacterium]
MASRVVVALALVLAAAPMTLAQAARERGWPRERSAADGTRMVIYQPQIDEWNSYVELKFRMAIELWQPGARSAAPGALQMACDTNTDLANRSVSLYNLRILSAGFPGADDATVQKLQAALARIGPPPPMTASVDDVLAYFEPGQQATPSKPAETRNVADAPEPPLILTSATPAILVMFDGEPVFAPVESTRLVFAVNTNWNVFQEQGNPRTYLLYENSWLQAPGPTGPWEPAAALPQAFRGVPDNDTWDDVRANVPGKPLPRARMPRVFASVRPAELIVTDGPPKFESIPGTGLSWVTNTASDLFRDAQASYYFLASGRWFRASSLDGPWTYATSELPADFARIPKDHPLASVRVSVPGTPEADEAVLLAQVPHQAEVDRRTTTADVTYSGEPQFKPIEGTTMSYAINTPYDVIYVENRYYTCTNAVWFVAGSASGPWVVADTVPAVIYSIPPSCPKYNVTYVKVYSYTPTTVVVGYTSGYMGVYVSGGVVVYGTAYYYPPYFYYPPGFVYPFYYPYPYTYGFHAVYYPYSGVFVRSATIYGPYGGVGYGRAYNPATGTYGHGIAAAGPYQAGFIGEAYNPRTGTYAATYQRSNPYQSWGESVVTRGDEWMHTGHYSDSRGTIAAAETSKGGKAIGVSTDDGRTAFAKSGKNNNMYAAHDGNVYRNTGGGWQTYDDGDWKPVEKPENVTGKSARSTKSGQEQPPAARAGGGAAEAKQRPGAGGEGTRTVPARSGSSAWSQNSAQVQRDQRARTSSMQRQRVAGARPGGGGGGRRR